MLKFENVNAFYGKKQVIFNAVANINSGITCVLGKNGSGKTTLFSLPLNQIKYSGDIILNGQNIKEINYKERAKMLSFLPQSLNSTALTVFELVMLARIPYLSFNKPNKNDFDLVNKAIEMVKLTEKTNQKVSNLSGGEKQRAYLALVLAGETETVIFDEPLSYLDPEFSALFLQIVKKLKDEKKCVIIIMHDINKAFEIADNILLISNGAVKFYDSKEKAIENKILETEFNLKQYEIIENNKREVIFK